MCFRQRRIHARPEARHISPRFRNAPSARFLLGGPGRRSLLADRRDGGKNHQRNTLQTRAKKSPRSRAPEIIPSNFQINPRHHSQKSKTAEII
jgi:hypothetical protein